MTNGELTARFCLAWNMVQEGHALASPSHGKIRGVLKKAEDASTIVTAVDSQIEEMMTGKIRRYFPDDQIIGEEGAEQLAKHDAPAWILDPLDGSGFFERGMFPWGNMAAVLEQGIPRIGAVAVENNVYVAHEHMRHVLRNEVPFNPPPPRPPNEWRVSVEFPTTFKKRFPKAATEIFATLPYTQLYLNSAAGQGIYVLEGRLDGFIHPGLALWDCAALALLFEKCGMCLTRWDGSPLFPHIWNDAIMCLDDYRKETFRYDLVAAPKENHEKLLECVRPYAELLENAYNISPP